MAAYECEWCDHPHPEWVLELVERIIESSGPTVEVTVIGIGTFVVPRAYIALHGIAGGDLPELAAGYGWEKT